MNRLMPQGSYRWCQVPACLHRFYVAAPAACKCPNCGGHVPDATAGWPHVCSAGHGASHGGPCGQCVEHAAEKIAKAERRAREMRGAAALVAEIEGGE